MVQRPQVPMGSSLGQAGLETLLHSISMVTPSVDQLREADLSAQGESVPLNISHSWSKVIPSFSLFFRGALVFCGVLELFVPKTM